MLSGFFYVTTMEKLTVLEAASKRILVLDGAMGVQSSKDVPTLSSMFGGNPPT